MAAKPLQSSALPAELSRVRWDGGQLKYNHIKTIVAYKDSMVAMQKYHEILAANILKPDKHQFKVVQKLEALCQLVSSSGNSASYKPSLFQRFFSMTPRKSWQGIYLYGGVGSGKTMLMDLFYQACSIQQKKRIHYNSFMLNVHSRTTLWSP